MGCCHIQVMLPRGAVCAQIYTLRSVRAGEGGIGERGAVSMDHSPHLDDMRANTWTRCYRRVSLHGKWYPVLAFACFLHACKHTGRAHAACCLQRLCASFCNFCNNETREILTQVLRHHYKGRANAIPPPSHSRRGVQSSSARGSRTPENVLCGGYSLCIRSTSPLPLVSSPGALHSEYPR